MLPVYTLCIGVYIMLLEKNIIKRDTIHWTSNEFK